MRKAKKSVKKVKKVRRLKTLKVWAVEHEGGGMCVHPNEADARACPSPGRKKVYLTGTLTEVPRKGAR